MRQSANLVRKHIVVNGLVQGVGFRYFTVTQARRLGVRGGCVIVAMARLSWKHKAAATQCKPWLSN